MTTKKAKTFDCVAMKRELQAKLAAETAGMTWDEKVAYYNKKAMSGPLAAFWRKVDAAQSPSPPQAKPPGRKHGRGTIRRKRSR